MIYKDIYFHLLLCWTVGTLVLIFALKNFI